MTISLLAHDAVTGAFGMVVSSSSPAVAARCLHLRAGVGAVASQNVTNPALGTALLDALEAGADAESAISAVLADEAHPQHRQLIVVDAGGRTALHSGERALGVHAAVQGSAAAAGGNLLADDGVPAAMLAAFAASTGATLEERLLDALRGAIGAGGEAGPVRSAGLAVVEDVPWRVTDLRVDDADDPVAELARLLGVWLPQKQAYRTRALDPEDAPSYGVPGDE